MSRTLASCLWIVWIVVATSAYALEVGDNTSIRGDELADDGSWQLGVADNNRVTATLPSMTHPETAQTTVVAAISQDEVNALRLATAHGIIIKNAGLLIDHPRTFKPRRPSEDNAEERLVARLTRARRGLKSENAKDAIHEIKLLAETAAEHDVGSVSAAAQFQLGELYYAGRIVPHDEALAITYFRMAAFAGHRGARTALAAIYRQVGLPSPEFPTAVRRTRANARRSQTSEITFSGFVEFAQLLPLANDVSFNLRNSPSYVPLTSASLIKKLREPKRREDPIGGKKALNTSAVDARLESHGHSRVALQVSYNRDVEVWQCYCVSRIRAA